MTVRKPLVQVDQGPVGRVFVLGQPNAQGEFVIVLGAGRWRIRLAPGVEAGERVRVVSAEEDWIQVASVKTELEARH